MKITKQVMLAGLLAASGNALAQAQLQVDDHIKVTAINGQEVRQSLLQPLQKNFTLEAGRHVITARYDRLFDIRHNEHDYLKSGNITLTVDLQDKQTYQLIMPNQPSTYTAAKEYIKAPSLAVTHQGQIIAQQNTADSRSGLLTGVVNAIGGVFSNNSNNNAVAVNQQTIASMGQPTHNTQTTKSNLDQFMQIWLNSSEAEREKIRQWIAQ